MKEAALRSSGCGTPAPAPAERERSRRELDWLAKLAIALTNTRGPASVEVEDVQTDGCGPGGRAR